MLVAYLTIFFVGLIVRGDDSLKEALHAVQKRSESYVTPVFYSRPYLYDPDGQPEDIGYGYQKLVPDMGFFGPAPLPYNELGSSDVDDRSDVSVDNFVFDYLREAKPQLKHRPLQKKTVFREREPTEAIERIFDTDRTHSQSSTRKPSPFRERFGKYRTLSRPYGVGGNFPDSGVYQLNGAAAGQLGGGGRRGEDDPDDEYLAILNQVMDKYNSEEDPEYLSQDDIEEILEYFNSKDEKKRQYDSRGTSYDFFNSPMTWSKRPKMEQKRYGENLFDERYSYKDFQKRYPIAKRSLTYFPVHLERQKKNDKQTDPKVQAVLSDIFDSNKAGRKNDSTMTTTTTPTTTTAASAIPQSTAKFNQKVNRPGQKEQTIDTDMAKLPVETRGIQKKSIKWSDYFGLDRKKKTADWLVDKYLRQKPVSDKKKRSNPEDIDSKMRALEDIIVDEAVKFTGSHEGSRDSEEIQQVKDKVMSQLAAAYSLEKMRRALGEFKASIAAQQSSAPSAVKSSFRPAEMDNKRSKFAEKKEKPEPNEFEKKQGHDMSPNALVNHVHHTDRDEDEKCPVLAEIARRCRDITKILGEEQNEYLVNLCNFHQVCYLCGPQLRAASPHECDSAFAMEAEASCQGDPECLYDSRRTLHAIRYAKPMDRTCNWRSNRCLADFLSRVVNH